MSAVASEQRIVVERIDRITRAKFVRPDRLNALDPAMLQQLSDALAAAHADGTNVFVMSATGRAFVAGVDIDSPYFMEGVEDTSVFAGTRLLDHQHELISAVRGAPFITVAAINGDTIGGGGFGLAMACDMRFAVEHARFWLVPGQLNVVQDFGLTWTLQRLIGSARTLELAVTGQRVDALTGERWGFLNRAFSTQDDLDRHIGGLETQLAAIGPDALRLLKFIVRHGESSSLEDQLRTEAIANGLCFSSSEFRLAKQTMLAGLGRGNH